MHWGCSMIDTIFCGDDPRAVLGCLLCVGVLALVAIVWGLASATSKWWRRLT